MTTTKKTVKPVHKSRTNATVLALVAAVVGERIARKLGMEPDVVTEALLGAGELALGALAIYFRQRANVTVDAQDVDTPTADALAADKPPVKKPRKP